MAISLACAWPTALPRRALTNAPKQRRNDSSQLPHRATANSLAEGYQILGEQLRGLTSPQAMAFQRPYADANLFRPLRWGRSVARPGSPGLPPKAGRGFLLSCNGLRSSVQQVL